MMGTRADYWWGVGGGELVGFLVRGEWIVERGRGIFHVSVGTGDPAIPL